jgi:hypothetical protein
MQCEIEQQGHTKEKRGISFMFLGLWHINDEIIQCSYSVKYWALQQYVPNEYVFAITVEGGPRN